MPESDPLMLMLALLISIVATVLGVSNLIWFVQNIEQIPLHQPSSR